MILVCGEALIDLFVGDGSGGARLPVQAAAGGSPFNLAIGLARLGAPVGFLGGLSQDSFGAFLTARLAAEGVQTGLARRSTRPTPLAIVSPDPAGHPTYTFHAHGCADRDLTPADLPAALGPEIEALAMGSFSLAVEPIGSALLALAEREAARRVVSIDPNLRPDVVGDLDRWRERFDRFLHASSIVKLSLEDLQAAYGSGANPEELARRWLDMGVGLVVLTTGDKGATAWSARGSAVQAGRRIDVADTVGAGDTFHAALLARLRQRGLLNREALAAVDTETLGDLLHYGTVAAGITCGRRGADLPRAAEVEAALGGPRG